MILFRIIMQIILILFELVFSASIAIYAVSMLYSQLKGAPYVPSNQKEIEELLKLAGLKPKQLMIELGSGDGRVLRTAVKNYKVQGIGIDVNPVLNSWATFLAKRQKLLNIKFISKNIFDYDLSKADAIYLFLMPELIDKLENKFNHEIRPKTIVISHGFEIKFWKKYLIKKRDHKPFPTYYYLIT